MNLQDIAKAANVSTATVSRAINRVPNVDPVLARRVWRVIEQVGYYPNKHARALVSGHSRILGLVVSEITNPFFPEIVQTFTELGISHNYEVLLSFLPEDSGLIGRAARQMIERRVDGVAILTFGREEGLVEVFRRQNLPMVAVDIDSEGPLCLRVDYQHGIRQAVQHLAALGHERIAFIGGPATLKTAQMRRIAFLECMREIDLVVSLDFVVEGDHTMEAGMKSISALALLPERPSAVVCSNDMTAIGVMRQAFELAIEVPRDLSVVGFDDIRLAQFMTPPLTTVQMSQTEIANTAFRALLECVTNEPNQKAKEPYSINTNLVLRRSTALAPGRLRWSSCESQNVTASAKP